jgi:hypothetical protein
MLCIITQVALHGYRFGEVRVDKVSIAPLASTVRKAGPFEVSDELSHFRRH